ncbi:Aquaporin-like protein [Pseudocohnilembus persalinus]|uniref:Aquaporin-like protein n=1 Tax=Pseudocohnilembus persalinus TaxID=266149 RepID=A0A0V0QWB6_PSEPJ|nr:Aquaporin-like protein [Pseudocohnilembus persalinus]|eukprot:KRX06365.1 Aquaporin-like protein [Pseudocohnilembus persalinus]
MRPKFFKILNILNYILTFFPQIMKKNQNLNLFLQFSVWEIFGTAILAYGCCLAQNNIHIITTILGALIFTQPFSGGHFNSAVSLGFLLNNNLNIIDFLMRSLAQLLGGFIGCFFAIIVTNQIQTPEIIPLAQNQINQQFQENHIKTNNNSDQQSNNFGFYNELTGEIIATFFLMFASLIMSDKQTTYYKGSDKIVPNITIIYCVLTSKMLSPRTGGNLNPSIGLAMYICHGIFYGELNQNSPMSIVVYGPYLGAIIGALYYIYIHYPLVVNEKQNKKYNKQQCQNKLKQKSKLETFNQLNKFVEIELNEILISDRIES